VFILAGALMAATTLLLVRARTTRGDPCEATRFRDSKS
jgi:hypothetical protein